MNRRIRYGLTAIVVLLAGIRANPELLSDSQRPPEVKRILQRNS